MASAFAKLYNAAIQAYRTDKITYFYYLLRVFLKEELEKRRPERRLLPGQIRRDLRSVFTKGRNCHRQTPTWGLRSALVQRLHRGNNSAATDQWTGVDLPEIARLAGLGNSD